MMVYAMWFMLCGSCFVVYGCDLWLCFIYGCGTLVDSAEILGSEKEGVHRDIKFCAFDELILDLCLLVPQPTRRWKTIMIVALIITLQTFRDGNTLPTTSATCNPRTCPYPEGSQKLPRGCGLACHSSLSSELAQSPFGSQAWVQEGGDC